MTLLTTELHEVSRSKYLSERGFFYSISNIISDFRQCYSVITPCDTVVKIHLKENKKMYFTGKLRSWPGILTLK